MYPLKDLKYSNSWGSKRSIWSESFEPNMEFTLFSSSMKDYELSIVGSDNKTLYTSQGKFDNGFNFINFNLKSNENSVLDYLAKGSYKVLIMTDKDNLEKEFQIK
jgi:hypothetical protein